MFWCWRRRLGLSPLLFINNGGEGSDFFTTDYADPPPPRLRRDRSGRGLGEANRACEQAAYVPNSGMTGYEKNWVSGVSGKRF